MDDFVVSREANQPQELSTPKQRACANCARLKMKCQWPASGSEKPGSSCVRCTRMKLACHVPEAAPRKKRGKSTRVAQLEKKLDGIVELLAANQAQQKGPSPLTPESPETQAQLHSQPLPKPSTQPASQSQSQSLSHHHHHHHHHPRPDHASHPLPKEPYPFNGADHVPDRVELLMADVPFDEAPCLELLPGFRISQLEAAEALDTYRTAYLPSYPFLPFPQSMTARDLYNHSRFLFWTVMSVVVPLPGSVQHNVRNWFRKYLAEHVMIRQEKRLDILQAIIIHLGWNDFPFYLEAQATPTLQLAVALIIDLQLDKSPASTAMAQRTLLGDAWQTNHRKCGKMKTSHSLEDKRAVLGFYHLSSLLSMLFRRGVAFPWSNFLAQCTEAVLEAKEYESDLLLVALVKMHHMAERAYSVMRATEHQDQISIVFRAPLDMAINNARRELDNFAKSQPEIVREKKIFWSHYYILIMRLYEPILMMVAPSPSDHDSLSAEPFQRAEALWKLVQCINTFYEHQLSIPAAELCAFPVTAGGFNAFTIVTSARLLFAENAPDWDASLARRRLDFPGLLRRWSEQYELAQQTAVRGGRRLRILDDGTSMFLKYSYKARWIRQWYLNKIPPDEQQQYQMDSSAAVVAATATTVATTSSSAQQQAAEAMPGWAADFQFDENFWQELMSMSNYDITDIPLTNAMPAV